RIAVELGPTRVVMGNDVEHQVIGPDRLEAVVAECARELPGESRMLVHHDRQAGRSWRRGLNDHRHAPPILSAGWHPRAAWTSAPRARRLPDKLEPHPTSSRTARAASAIARWA